MHAWFDISAGVAGDMLLGALIDAGADPEGVATAIEAVAPGSVRLEREQVSRCGQRGTKVRVRVLVADPPHGTWASIKEALVAADLAEVTRGRALAVFARLAAAESRAHGVEVGSVHFHEVGALDSIADVVGVCEALRSLGVTSISASPVRLGSGRVRAAHGDLPVPVPAVAELAIGWQVYPTPSGAGTAHVHGDQHPSPPGHGHFHDTPAAVISPGSAGELATPTGLALIRSLAVRCESLPGLVVSGVGVGAGSKDLEAWPNVVRVILGQRVEPESAVTESPGLTEVMANVDDLDPRLWPGVLDALLAAGAADAWLVPVQMKKGRPGFTVHALTDGSAHDRVVGAILEHTSTLGVREVAVARTIADRCWVDVEVDGAPLAVKIGSRAGRILHSAAEFEELAALAASLGRTPADLAQRAGAAIVAAGLTPGAPVPRMARVRLGRS